MQRCGECPMPPGRDCHPMYCDFLRSGEPTKVAHVRALAARPPPAFPPLTEQAANLAGAVTRFMASGMEMTSAEERSRRLAICADCEHFALGPPGRCQLCGCITNLAARVASKHCPDDPPRW